MLHLAVVENEKKASDQTLSLLERYFTSKNLPYRVSVFENGFDFLENHPESFDAVFLDIDMPGKNGVEVAEELRAMRLDLTIVFVTNLAQFALEGYKVSAMDFLLKPVSYVDLAHVMDKIVGMQSPKDFGDFLLPLRSGVQRFRNEDILYIILNGHDVILHSKNGEEVSFRGSIRNIAEKVNPDILIRCNSGTFVSLLYLDRIDGDSIVLQGGDTFPISRSKKKDVLKAMSVLYQKELVK